MSVPSLGWLCAKFRKHFNQRATFGISNEHWAVKYLISEVGFSPDKPIVVNAIFTGIFKRPPRDKHESIYSRYSPEDMVVTFQFRDVLFGQEGKPVAFVFNNRRINKTMQQGFTQHEIISKLFRINPKQLAEQKQI